MLRKVVQAAKIAATLNESRHRKFWMQRMVTSVPQRVALAQQQSARVPRPDWVPQSDSLSRAAVLQRDGYVMTPDMVPDAWVTEMRDYFNKSPCADNYRPELGSFVGPQNAPPGTHVAFFDHDCVVNSPRGLEIANLPGLVETVAANLGGKPTISYMTAWWSVPANDGAQHGEKFHRDVDDIDFIKFFLYLTEVDEECGPHVYIKGSHLDDRLTKIRRYDDSEIHDTFGRENEIRFMGDPGTCFLEKTYGFHRGYPPKTKPRLIFQVLFSLRETIYGPKKPIYDPSARGLSIDPFMNRVYCRAP